MEDCIFCKIVSGQLPSKKEYEDDEILAFDDIKPSAPVHVIIIPKKHIRNLYEAKENDRLLLGKIQLTAVALAEKLGIGKAFRVSTLSGGGAGQEVFHLHYHLQGGWDKSKAK